MSYSLLDYVRGECDPAEATRIEARLAADPALSRERDRLAALLSAVRSAHEVRPDPAAAMRVAARVRDWVLREEEHTERAARTPQTSRRMRWARLLAVSVAAHVVLLGVLGFKIHQNEQNVRTEPPFHEASTRGILERTPADEDDLIGVVDEGTLRYDTRIRAEDFLPPESLASFHLPSSDLDAPLAMRDPRLDPFLPSVGRQMLFRTWDELKRAVLARSGAENAVATLADVKRSLRFLSGAQRSDGSFADEGSEPSVKLTALALLAFLGDGHSARGGEYGSVVDRGIGWLGSHAAAAPASSARAVALYALTEDFMLSNGVMTPAESAERGHEITELARSLAKAPTKGEDALWTPLALSAVSRAGLLPATGSVDRATRWAGAFLDATNIVDVSRPLTDPRDAVLNGLALLLAPRAKAAKFPTFTAWNTDALATVSSMLGPDGAAKRKHAGADATRIESTALIALALELAYRTF